MSERFDRIKNLAVSFSTRRSLIEAVREKRWDKVDEILQQVLEDFPIINRIVLADLGGIVKVDEPELPGFRGSSVAYRDWFQGVSKSGKPYTSEIFTRQTEIREHVVAVAAPIRDSNLEIIGLLQLQLLLDPFLSWSQDKDVIDVGPSGFVYFVDKRGHIGGHPKFPSQGDLVDFSAAMSTQKVLRGEEGVEILFNPIEKEERVTAFNPVREHGWGVIVQQPTRVAFARRNSILRELTYIYGAVLFVVLGLVLIILHIDAHRRVAEEKILGVVKAKSDFISIISHELRSPLLVIREGITMVYEGEIGPISEDQRRFLGLAKKNVDRLGRLINDVLDFQKLDSGEAGAELQLTENDLNATVQEVVHGFVLVAKKKGIVLLEECDPSLPLVRINKDKITQVLVNLLNNAIKFTEKGKIVVRTEKRDHLVRVSVEDDGPGIRQEDLSKLFKSFSQISSGLPKSEGSTGLGLAISKKIIEAHNGHLEVSSVVGHGSTFFFTLPIDHRT